MINRSSLVGNPPYITVKDRALNEAYRLRFESCHRKYSLAAPFMEQFFALAVKGEDAQSAGYVGMITANSFMKREFGKKLIEEFIPRWNLTHVIDTAGAYIPGHGTPTVILFGTHRKPIQPTIRTVMGIKGEPATPDEPAHGLVWGAILRQVDQPGTESEFVSVTDSERDGFRKHPWSIGGGGAAELKEMLDEVTEITLVKVANDLGFMAITGEDEALTAPHHVWRKVAVPFRGSGSGDTVRDWIAESEESVPFLYSESDGKLQPVAIESHPRFYHSLWCLRTNLRNRKMFGKLPAQFGLAWNEFIIFMRKRFLARHKIAFADVATHNHFVLVREDTVFKQTAPVITLPSQASEDDHLSLIGLLNSSLACFWMKQVFFPKGGDHVGTEGARVRTTMWDERYAHDSTKLKQFPVTTQKPLVLAQELDRLAQEMKGHTPAALLAQRELSNLKEKMTTARAHFTRLRERMIAIQEELDWECYRYYDLLVEDVNLPPASHDLSQIRLQLGERAFEIVMARKMAWGELETTWFSRHGSTPITEIPAHWPATYRQLVERRIALIESDRNIALIEQPEYKRRWNTEPWEEQQERALREWLLGRLESVFGVPPSGGSAPEPDEAGTPNPELTSCAHLADKVSRDTEFMEVAALYRARPDFDLTELVVELVESESVPFLPILASARQAGRAEGAFHHLPALQSRRRPHPRHRLGRLGPIAASSSRRRLLRAHAHQ